MASMVAFVDFWQPEALYVPPNGTTTGPAVPFPPLCIWAAVGVPPRPLTFLNDQQAVAFVAFRWTTAVPLAADGPFFGASAPPVSLADTTGLIDAWAARATSGTATSTSTTAIGTRTRICFSSRWVDRTLPIRSEPSLRIPELSAGADHSDGGVREAFREGTWARG